MANENNWVKILINKLELSTTAEFCRKTDLGRGLVDKLSAGDNQPRFDTLQKIKNAFPQTNMNWLISFQYQLIILFKIIGKWMNWRTTLKLKM